MNNHRFEMVRQDRKIFVVDKRPKSRADQSVLVSTLEGAKRRATTRLTEYRESGFPGTMAFIYPHEENFVIAYVLSKRDRAKRMSDNRPTGEFL